MRGRLQPLLAILAATLVLPVAAGAAPSARSPFSGVVEIWVKAQSGGAIWAASGIVLTSSGAVLTTNDVIRGASSITATDAWSSP